MVLSSGAWPFSQGPPFALPLEVRVHVIQLKYSSASAVIHAGSQCVMLCSKQQNFNATVYMHYITEPSHMLNICMCAI